MVRRRIRLFLASPLVDATIRVIVVLSLVVGGVAFYQTRELTRCVANYNNANNDRSAALTQAAEQEREAERTADAAQAALFLSPILTKPANTQTAAEREQLLQLFRAYQSALAKQNEERATADDARRAHPIPDPPDEVCG